MYAHLASWGSFHFSWCCTHFCFPPSTETSEQVTPLWSLSLPAVSADLTRPQEPGYKSTEVFQSQARFNCMCLPCPPPTFGSAEDHTSPERCSTEAAVLAAHHRQAGEPLPCQLRSQPAVQPSSRWGHQWQLPARYPHIQLVWPWESPPLQLQAGPSFPLMVPSCLPSCCWRGLLLESWYMLPQDKPSELGPWTLLLGKGREAVKGRTAAFIVRGWNADPQIGHYHTIHWAITSRLSCSLCYSPVLKKDHLHFHIFACQLSGHPTHSELVYCHSTALFWDLLPCAGSWGVWEPYKDRIESLESCFFPTSSPLPPGSGKRFRFSGTEPALPDVGIEPVTWDRDSTSATAAFSTRGRHRSSSQFKHPIRLCQALMFPTYLPGVRVWSHRCEKIKILLQAARPAIRNGGCHRSIWERQSCDGCSRRWPQAEGQPPCPFCKFAHMPLNPATWPVTYFSQHILPALSSTFWCWEGTGSGPRKCAAPYPSY